MASLQTLGDPSVVPGSTQDFWSQFTQAGGSGVTAGNPGAAVGTGALLGAGGTAAPGVAGPAGQQPAGANFGNLSDPAQWMALVQDPVKLKQWLTSSDPRLAQLFQQNPSLADYYVKQIQKSPGANPTEQAGSAQYWMNKALQDPGITGKSGGMSGGGGVGGQYPFGQYGAEYKLPSEQDALNMPGLQFAIDQAGNAVQRSAAAKGTLLTGGTLKALAGYTTGTALQGYGQLAGLQNNAFNTNYNIWRNNQNDTSDNLYRLSQLGKPGS